MLAAEQMQAIPALNDESKEILNALVEWYRFNNTLQSLLKTSEDDMHVSSFYERNFSKSSNEIHDNLMDSLSAHLDNLALNFAF